jgi:hypothetical protein
MFNRQQRRQLIRGTKRRGLGFTRQYSSARARRQHGTVCLGQVTDPESLSEHWQKVANYTPVSDTPTLDLVEEEAPELSDELMFQALAESLVGHSAKAIVAELNTGEYDEHLDLIAEVEQAGKGRKTVLAAIEKRR